MPENQTSTQNDSGTPQWDLFAEQMGAAFKTLHQGVDAHARFMKSLSENFRETDFDYPEFMPGGEELEEQYEGILGAYQTWMEAGQEMFDCVQKAVDEDEEIDVGDFRDIWLQASNKAFKEFLTTNAFADMTGESLDSFAEYKTQFNRMMNDTMHEMGLASAEDLSEVGQRLVELERRQQRVENKLDEILRKLD